MFNVLPDILKKEIRTSYKLRRLFVVLSAVLFLQISFLIFILPSWINVFFKEKDVISQTNNLSKSTLSQNAETASAIIASTNIKLKLINTELQYPAIMPLIRSIISNKTANIHIYQFNYSVTSTTSAAVTLSGMAASRESLINYENAINNSSLFSNVDLPISNLAKNKDIDFSMSLSASK